MKKTAILLLLIAALALTPFQAFAKPRVFLTLSDFISSGKYTLYQVKPQEVQQVKPAASSAQVPKPQRNIFSKTKSR